MTDHNVPDKPTRYKVTGPMRINDAEPGETVYLDPDKVNIGALLEAGAIEPVQSKSTTTATKSGDDSKK
jgi:hypothetical protein